VNRLGLRIGVMLAGTAMVLWCHAAVAMDPTVYVFPDRVSNQKHGGLGGAYIRAVEKIDAYFDSLHLKATDTLSSMPAEPYQALRLGLEDVVRSTPLPEAALYARRRLIILDWLALRKDSRQAADEILALGQTTHSTREKNFNAAMAMTVLVRDRRMGEARQLFEQLSATQTPQLGWFGFNQAKNWALYIQECVPEFGSPMSGLRTEVEEARIREFAEFLEDAFIPKFTEYLDSDLSGLTWTRKLQVLLAMKRMLNEAHGYIVVSRYPELAAPAREQIIRPLVDLLEKSLPLYENMDIPAKVPGQNVYKQTVEKYRRMLEGYAVSEENDRVREHLGRPLRDAQEMMLDPNLMATIDAHTAPQTERRQAADPMLADRTASPPQAPQPSSSDARLPWLAWGGATIIALGLVGVYLFMRRRAA
jgi:hypothetical protein